MFISFLDVHISDMYEHISRVSELFLTLETLPWTAVLELLQLWTDCIEHQPLPRLANLRGGGIMGVLFWI